MRVWLLMWLRENSNLWKSAGKKALGGSLEDWAGETEKREEITKWKEQLQSYSPFGIYKINVVNPESGEMFTADFALDVNFDELAFEDNFEFEKQKNPNNINGVNIFFFVGLIPTSEEVLKKKWSIKRTANSSGIAVEGEPLLSVHTHWKTDDLATRYFNKFIKDYLQKLTS